MHAYENSHLPERLVHNASNDALEMPAVVAVGGGGDGTQLQLELEEVLERMVGMVEYNESHFAIHASCDIGLQYRQNSNFHEQFQAYQCLRGFC
jgi:hypothetical protein